MLSGEQVRQFREAQGLTIRQLAEKTGVHFLLLGRYEKGSVKQLKPEQDAGIAAVMESIYQGTTLPGPLLSPYPPPASTPPVPDRRSYSQTTLDLAADTLADWFCTLDPTWRSRLDVMKAERGFSTLQALSTCVAYVLEHDMHMMIVKHEALEPSPWRRGEQMECPECHTLYKPSYPGQPFCKNGCAEAHRRVHA